MTCVGCGRSFQSARSDARYCGELCRKRASRARDRTSGIAVPEVAGKVDSGTLEGADPGSHGSQDNRLREGLEGWLAGYPWLPGAVVAQARMLADELDSEPSDSPLHGRFSTVLQQLLEASRVPADPDAEVARLQAEIFGGG